MTTDRRPPRTWNPGDPEPEDRPDVVDSDGDVWSFEYYTADVLDIDPLQPDEAPGGWWLRTGPYRGGDLWPSDEVTRSGTVTERTTP